MLTPVSSHKTEVNTDKFGQPVVENENKKSKLVTKILLDAISNSGTQHQQHQQQQPQKHFAGFIKKCLHIMPTGLRPHLGSGTGTNEVSLSRLERVALKRVEHMLDNDNFAQTDKLTQRLVDAMTGPEEDHQGMR